MEIRVTKKGHENGLGHENELIDVAEHTAKELKEKGLAEDKYAVKTAAAKAVKEETAQKPA